MSDKDFDRIIGARLKEARISAGYETAQAAADARPKVHVQSVRDQEAGRRGVSPEQLLLYSKKYAVSIQWLITRNVAKASDPSCATSLSEPQFS